ncbi:MAG: hypothetical protein KGQ48_06250, partial [Bradyrhizobium sp.]|nr:hypothetical protein [Bradyrhizobium sp.]
DFTPSQWVAAMAGFFVSAGAAHILVAQGYLPRNWAMILVVVGFGAPPAIVGWLKARKRKVS